MVFVGSYVHGRFHFDDSEMKNRVVQSNELIEINPIPATDSMILADVFRKATLRGAVFMTEEPSKNGFYRLFILKPGSVFAENYGKPLADRNKISGGLEDLRDYENRRAEVQAILEKMPKESLADCAKRNIHPFLFERHFPCYSSDND